MYNRSFCSDFYSELIYFGQPFWGSPKGIYKFSSDVLTGTVTFRDERW